MKLRLQLGCKRLADYKSEPLMMSKQIVRGIILLSLICLVTASLLISGHSEASGSQTAGVAKGSARNAAIIATTEAVLKETSDLRELSILRAVKSGAQSRTEIERMIIKNLNDESTPAEMHATEVVLKRLRRVSVELAKMSQVTHLKRRLQIITPSLCEVGEGTGSCLSDHCRAGLAQVM